MHVFVFAPPLSVKWEASRDFLQTYVKCPSSFWHVDLRLVDSPVQLYKASGCRGDDFWKMDKAAKAAILRVFGILSFLQVVKVDV